MSRTPRSNRTAAEVIAAAAGAAAIKPAEKVATTAENRSQNTVETADVAADKPARKKYVARFNVFTKLGERRASGADVFDDEIDEAGELVERGILSDPDEPVAPSIAGKLAVHKELISIALDGALITRSGSAYTFGGKSMGDLDVLRSAFSVADLRDAIVKKLKGIDCV